MRRSTPPRWNAVFYRRSPIFSHLAFIAESLADCADWPDHVRLSALLAAHLPRAGRPLRAVEPAGKRSQAAYERRVFAGLLPTRAGDWHDLLNVLTWCAFPLAKAALNARHCAALAASAGASRRTPEQDALTLFDEAGVVFATADPPLANALLGCRWHELFVERRAAFGRTAACVAFGHGLLCQALDPYIGLTGKALIVRGQPPQGAPLHAWLDGHLAALVGDPARLATPAELAPLPILGVPGWWPANEVPEFYDDDTYFRAGRGGH